MILDDQDPTHQHTKGISLPQHVKINEIKLKPFSGGLQFDGLPASLCRLCNWILFATGNTSLPVMLDKFLCDIEVLVSAVCPGPLLAHVIIPPVPLINGIKDLFHGHNCLARY